MATLRKRRSSDGSIDAQDFKKFRISNLASAPMTEESDIDRDQLEHVSSDEEDGRTSAETPNTPFSPATRTKFPSEFKNIKCTHEGCLKTFNRPARLEAHLRSHTNDRTFVCTFEGCEKKYLQDKHLKQHVKGSHTHERSYTCEWDDCDKSFLTATRLRRHQDAHQGRERFRCTSYPPCNRTFRKHQTLQRHVRSDHLVLAPYPCTSLDPLTNTPCQAGFDGAAGLRKHQETVHTIPQFMCNSCTIPGHLTAQGHAIYLGFITQKQLDTHIYKCHADCLFCERNFPSQRELQKHMDNQHSGTTVGERKTIRCTFTGCSKAFTKKSNLKVHIRTSHNGERFICGTFDISTTPAFAFWDFESDGCGSDFFSRANLEDHVRIAHLGLPSQINGNRKKVVKSLGNEVDELDGEIVKKRSKKQKPDFIEDFVGLDQRRDIPCPTPGCTKKFMRHYDVEKHLQAMHRGKDEQESHGAAESWMLNGGPSTTAQFTLAQHDNIDPELLASTNNR